MDYKFQKLTPVHDVDLSIYKDALDFVFANEDIKNVGVSGAYCAGKSSVIESYKKLCPEKKFIHISLANFEPKDTAEQDNDDKDADIDCRLREATINENVLEGKILNQLIHQISTKKIPQTNFRVKRTVSKRTSWGVSIGILLFCLSWLYFFGFNQWQEYVEGLSAIWLKKMLSWSANAEGLLISGIIIAGLMALLFFKIVQLQKNKSFFKRVSVQGNEIEIFEESNDSYFDKYLNEVLYLFENSDADVIIFEDMDRYNANQIFQRLREVNTLINNRRKKKGISPLRFFFLLRDDIFVSKDRTKFFDFIMPIVPIIDGSNSYDQFIAHFKAGGLFDLFDESFLQGISLYVDDMRILKNIYNEFVIYNKRISTTEQNANKLIALIVYKNIFPRDFSDLQLNKGFVSNLFAKKDLFVTNEKQGIQKQITVLENRIEFINNEVLESESEVDLVYTNPPKSDYYNNTQKKYISERDSRKQAIRERADNTIDKIKGEITNLKQQRQFLQNKKLCQIINRGNIETIFQSEYTNEIGITNHFNEIKSSEYFPLLKYLIRNGFIDETYPDYMTYFYEKSLSRVDKIFLRSVTDESAKEYTYSLQKPEMVVSRLRIVDFDNEEILNFDLLGFLLQTQSRYHEQLNRFVLQLKNNKSFDFIAQFIASKKETSCFIKYVNYVWPQLFYSIIQESNYSDDQKIYFVLLSIYSSPNKDLLEMNKEDAFTEFIINHPDFLQIDKPKIGRLIEAFKLLKVKFLFIEYAISEPNLWNEVYSNNLYELNWEMIETILQNHYHIPKDKSYSHKNLSLILSKDHEPLVLYIQENIDEYMEVMLQHCNNQISDIEETAIYVLNNEKLTDEHIERYIDCLSTPISSLRSVDDIALWQKLIENELLSYSEDNVLLYFFKMSKAFDNVLTQFINDCANSYLFEYDDIDETFGANSGDVFLDAVVQCNALENEKYGAILQSLDQMYEPFAIQGINAKKVDILIRLKIIPMTSEVLGFIRENYPNNLLLFIIENIDEYVDEVIDEEKFSFDEMIEVLNSNVDIALKIKLLEVTDQPISVEHYNYEAEIEAYILENNFSHDDMPYLLQNYDALRATSKVIVERLAITMVNDILSNEYEVSYDLLLKLLANQSLQLLKKLELFSLCLPDFNQDQCKACLKIIGKYDYLTLFDGKRPRFEINDTNENILSIFKKNGWITKFEKIGNTNYYRAIGRKKHEEQQLPIELL